MVKYSISDRNVFNSGGGCMVGVTTVRIAGNDRELFVFCSDEGCTLASQDFVFQDVEGEESEYIIESVSIDLIQTSAFKELFLDCLSFYHAYFN